MMAARLAPRAWSALLGVSRQVGTAGRPAPRGGPFGWGASRALGRHLHATRALHEGKGKDSSTSGALGPAAGAATSPSDTAADIAGGREAGVQTTLGQPTMVIAFTCNVCETRSVQKFSKGAYEKGVVLIQCPGCSNRHLIADNLGWFGDSKSNVETIMADKGEPVVRVDTGTLEWTPSEPAQEATAPDDAEK